MLDEVITNIKNHPKLKNIEFIYIDRFKDTGTKIGTHIINNISVYMQQAHVEGLLSESINHLAEAIASKIKEYEGEISIFTADLYSPAGSINKVSDGISLRYYSGNGGSRLDILYGIVKKQKENNANT